MLDNIQIQLVPQPWLELGPPAAPPRKRRVEEKPHADFLNLPNVICDPEKMKPGNWVMFAEAEQTPVPTYPPDCLCEVKEVKPHGTFLIEKIRVLGTGLLIWPDWRVP